MKKKQIISMLLVFCIFATMALGSGSDESSASSEHKEIVSSESNSESVSGETNSSNESVSNPETLAITIEEAIVYDENGILITAKEYSTDSIWGDGIKFLIENNSEQNITVTTNATIVNDYMVDDLFYADIAAGKKTNETLSLSSSELNAAGITSIGQIEVYFHIYDSDSWGEISDTEGITIKTSLYDSMDVVIDEGGTILYEENGIKIIGKYVDESSFWGTAVMLYCENNSGRNITVSVDDLSVNGFMISSFFNQNVYDGKMAYEDITLVSSDLEENDIISVDEISLKFSIYDPDSYNTIVETEEISFLTKK